MLLDLLVRNHEELIRRCRAKVALRFAPDDVPSVIEHGVPLFLQQLTQILRAEGQTSERPDGKTQTTPTDSDIGRAAALHGIELLHLGYSVDQVVHHYGDVCQGVAELAIEQHTTIGADQFRTLNRCLDQAIADAVTAFGHDREAELFHQAHDLHERLGFVADKQRQLLERAIQAFSAIKTGNIGVSGATGTVLINLLFELRDVLDQDWPELRLAAGMTTSTGGIAPASVDKVCVEEKSNRSVTAGR